MSKALNFDGKKSEPEAEARKIPNSGDVKKFIASAMDIEEKIDTLKEDLKQVYQDADDQGIPRKELKIVVKHKRKPMPLEARQGVNELFEKAGDQPYFAFV